QERRFRPVGATREVTSDFRLISATNRNLEAMVEVGEFRSDLLYRLKTIPLRIPPLRERKEDIKPLAMHFVNRLCERYGTPLKGIGADFFEILHAYDWPGNVRELANTLEQAFVASDRDKTLYAMHLPSSLRITVTKAQIMTARSEQEATEMAPLSMDGVGPDERAASTTAKPDQDGPLPSFKDFKAEAEAAYLKRLADEADGEVPLMLQLSGLSRSHLYTLLKKYDINI
ncbi:MAG: sigma 54-interacting transcriptional regulator, partial [Oceanidesulfovibrio sp.]